MRNEPQDRSGEPLGAGWLVASCMAFALAALLAWQVKTTKTADMVEGAVLVLHALAVLLVAGIGGVLGLLGASAAASAGNRRFVVLCPAIANFVLVLWFLGSTYGP